MQTNKHSLVYNVDIYQIGVLICIFIDMLYGLTIYAFLF